MPDRRRMTCVCCGKNTAQVGQISWNGYCRPCGKALMNENVEGIAAGTGYAHKRRLRGYARWLERATLDVVDTNA